TLVNLVTNTDVEPCLRRFEFNLLQDLGYGVCVDIDSDSGEEVDARCVYVFDPAEGVKKAVVSPSSATTFSGSTLLAIGRGDYSDPAVRVAAKRLVRLALAPHLGTKPLMSREFFRGASNGIRAAVDAGKMMNEIKADRCSNGEKTG